MARLSDFRSYTGGLSTGTNGATAKDKQPTISAELAEASTTEERRDVLVNRLDLDRPPGPSEASKQFEADCEKVGDLLERNDLKGLLKHGGRHTRERAEARAAAIRSDR